MALASPIWKDGKLGIEVRHSIGGGGEGFVLLTSPSSRPPASRPSFHVLAALVLAEDGSEERIEETSELSQPNWWAGGGFPHHRPSPPPVISPAVELMLLLLHRRCLLLSPLTPRHSDGLGSQKAM